jgi:hypothetical protein
VCVAVTGHNWQHCSPVIIIIISRRGLPCWNQLKQTIGGPRAGQRTLTSPIFYRDACSYQWIGSLASLGVLTWCKEGHHHANQWIFQHSCHLTVPVGYVPYYSWLGLPPTVYFHNIWRIYLAMVPALDSILHICFFITLAIVYICASIWACMYGPCRIYKLYVCCIYIWGHIYGIHMWQSYWWWSKYKLESSKKCGRSGTKKGCVWPIPTTIDNTAP